MAGHILKLENISRQPSLLVEPITNNMLMAKSLWELAVNYFYGAWDSVSNEGKTFKKSTSRLMVEETR